jgi:hypothetical protein
VRLDGAEVAPTAPANVSGQDREQSQRQVLRIPSRAQKLCSSHPDEHSPRHHNIRCTYSLSTTDKLVAPSWHPSGFTNQWRSLRARQSMGP